MRLSDLPHDRPVGTLMLLISLMVLGTVAIFELPLDFMPTVERPFIRVEISNPGSHPLENLRQIVEPLEEELATVSELEHIRSDSESGEADITVEFDWNVDLDLKKLEVREAVERALPELPENLGPIRLSGRRGGGPEEGAMLEARIAATRNLTEDWLLLENRIRRPLERIRGVARVELSGVEPQEVRIEIDPDALRRHGVQPRDLVQGLQDAHLDLDAGAIRDDALKWDVRSVGRFRTLEEVEALPIGRGDVRVGDIATVAIREPVIDYSRHLDRAFAIGLEVQQEASANTVETSDMLMAKIAEIQEDPQLEGIQLLVWSNAGAEIRKSLAGLRDAGIFGGVFVILVLYVFLRRFRATMVVATAIPFSLLVTCGVMYLLGSEFNVLTLLGLMLGVGMLVDNAVVVMENIHRLQVSGLKAKDAAREGARQVFLAVTAATATTVCVWAWLFFEGRSEMTIYLGAVALTICSAVVCSWLISLTFIPLAASRFVPTDHQEVGFVRKMLIPGYRGLLAWTLKHRFVTLAVLLALAATAIIPIQRIEKSSEPKEREVYAQVFFRSQDPSTLESMREHVVRMEGWIEENKEEFGYDSLYSWYRESGMGVIRLYLDPEEATAERIAEMTEKLQAGLEPVAGLTLEFGERQWWRRGGGDRRMVPVALHGEDPEYLDDLAKDIEERLKTLPDVVTTFGGAEQGRYEARVLVDPERARTFGVSPRAVAETVSLTFRGRNLARFQRDATELEMMVMLPEDLQPGLGALEDLSIPRTGPDGIALESIPLGAVADVTVSQINTEIEREDRQTSAWVTVEFDKDAVTTQDARMRVSQLMAGVPLPEGYTWSWGRWGQQREQGLQTMLLGVLMALVAVVLLMASLFESVTQPLAILITLPLAFFGSFWLLWLLGYELDIVAFMGIIILVGIVVNNGIVLVDHVNHLRREGTERRQALLIGCSDRLRPVLMTAISTIVGLIPLASSQFTVATAYVDSLAVAVIGGLTTSTLFTLIGLPVWYATLEDFGHALQRALPRRVVKQEEAVATS
ncbi:MAG: efflux RND transporter permease subunit [Acidobacteriota bacterium]